MEEVNTVKGEVKVEKLIDFGDTQGVCIPNVALESIVNANSQLAQTVTGLCQKMESVKSSQTVVWSRPLPSIARFSGRVKRPNELDEWMKDAEECITQVGFQGSEAVAFLCGFLDRPALTRVRNSDVKTVSELFGCLENAFGVKLSYMDLEKQLQSRVQYQGENVWEFADALVEIERKMQNKRERSNHDRKWLLHMWFCRNLRDRKIGVRLLKWWEEQSHVSWEELVQRAADKVDELEQIQREEAELKEKKPPGKVVREVSAPKLCSMCGTGGHLGFQCVQFKEGKQTQAGNGQPCGNRGQSTGSKQTPLRATV